MRRAARVLVAVLALVGVLAIAGGLLGALRGVSSKPEPPALEVTLTRGARHLMVPRSARVKPNPVTLDEAVIGRALAHFADHCATCHGNDGRGDTAYGGNLYPRAPDLTASATQSLSDGELFFLIENGIRFTGMPAFGSGTPEGETESWELVHFVRHLSRLEARELEAMKRLNPVSRAELEQEMEMERFLAGEDASPREAAGRQPDPGHRHP